MGVKTRPWCIREPTNIYDIYTLHVHYVCIWLVLTETDKNALYPHLASSLFFDNLCIRIMY
jgi:hypothetical protein